jgi:hypothetical protein
MDEEGLREKFAQSTNIKGVFRRPIQPPGFGLVPRTSDFEMGDGTPGLSALKMPPMAQNQLGNRLAEAREKFFTMDEICTELSALSTCTATLVGDCCVDRKRVPTNSIPPVAECSGAGQGTR